MTSKRVSAPFDLMAELQSDDPPLKMQGTIVRLCEGVKCGWLYF